MAWSERCELFSTLCSRERCTLYYTLCCICVMAPCVEPCLFCCPGKPPPKILPEDPDRPEWMLKWPTTFPPPGEEAEAAPDDAAPAPA